MTTVGSNNGRECANNYNAPPTLDLGPWRNFNLGQKLNDQARVQVLSPNYQFFQGLVAGGHHHPHLNQNPLSLKYLPFMTFYDILCMTYCQALVKL